MMDNHNADTSSDEDYSNNTASLDSGKLFQDVMETIVSGFMIVLIKEEDAQLLYINQYMLDMLGLQRSELKVKYKRFDYEGVYPEDIEKVKAHFGAAAASESVVKDKYRLQNSKGEFVWVHASIKAGKNGKEVVYYCSYNDVTELMAKQELKRKYDMERSRRKALDKATIAYSRWNLTKDKVEASKLEGFKTSLNPVGMSIDEAQIAFVNENISYMGNYTAVMKKLMRKPLLEAYLANEQVRCEYQGINRENEQIWVRADVSFAVDPDTGDVIAFVYSYDITEQKNVNALMKMAVMYDYEMLGSFNINSNSLINVVTNDGLIISKTSKNNITDLIGDYAHNVCQEDRESFENCFTPENILKELDTKDVYEYVFRIKEDDGTIRYKRSRFAMYDKDKGYLLYSRSDVTEAFEHEIQQREMLASALKAAEQASAAKTDFLSRMSHEIRTPLNAIIGMTAIAAQSSENKAQIEECISKIGISSRFLLSLINDILDMTRIESGKVLLKNEKFDMEDLIIGINNIIYAQAATKGIDYDCIIDPLLENFYIGDRIKIEQILINILGNSVKFTNAGGKITFSAQEKTRQGSKASMRFVINDTGIGMSQEYLPHIFDTFSQENSGTTSLYGGSGLGLAIAKNIIDLMGGFISVRSIKDIGTEFTIEIPLEFADELSVHKKKKNEYNFSSLKTLVVDDEVSVCESAVAILNSMGIAAEWVDSGHEAVKRVKENWAKKKFYDMILIDWKMPEMDGIETTRQVRQIVGPAVTIIIITAYDWMSIESEARAAGANMFITKPVFKSTLVSAFNKVFGEKEEQQKPETVNWDFTGKRVLVVEDHPMNIEVAKRLLENKGFTVEVAENGLLSLDAFIKSPEGYYDAILMDIRMPIMDGLSASSNIRNLKRRDAKSIPIIAMTANAFDDDIEKSRRAGMNMHLAKPIEPQKLYQVLYKFIFTESDDM